MQDFKHWGVKIRVFKDYNYHAIWNNLKTIRLGEGVAKELPPSEAEFYDVSINTLCNLSCPFCYVSAGNHGVNYENICETWKKWMSQYWEKKENGVIYTNKPFQIALGSTGEPCIHEKFTQFLQTVYETNVVPNYTTNGVIIAQDSKLSEEILDYTRNFVGGVAISVGNSTVRHLAFKAIEKLISKGNTKINIHHIISDKESVDEFFKIQQKYGNDIYYHVLLPLMPSGRSKEGIKEGIFEYLEEIIQKNNIKNIAFGAHFVKYLETSKIKTYLYPPESLSKNVILQKDHIKITPSSFNLNPIKEILL